ncbi:hypothetical protein ACSBR1_008707 [Camellia fascicularis]
MKSKGMNRSGVLDDLMREEEKATERINRKDYWLCEGIIVKVMRKALAEKGYYKQKGVVRKLIDKYVGEIEMFETKAWFGMFEKNQKVKKSLSYLSHIILFKSHHLLNTLFQTQLKPNLYFIKSQKVYLFRSSQTTSKHVLSVDQEELETVIPLIGGIVRIVNGAYRGSNARLLAVDTDKFCAKVQIEKGICDGRVIQAIEYEDICKVVC